MPSIPNWMLGKHVVSVTARFQLADATGALGNSTSTVQTLTGLVDGVQYAGSDTTENIVPLTSALDNEVAIEINDSFVFTEIMRNAANLNLLAGIWGTAAAAGADHVLLTVARGGTTGNTFTFYGTMTDYEEQVRKGKSIARLTVAMADIDAATANPAYASY